MTTPSTESVSGLRRRLIATAGLVALSSQTSFALADGMGPVRPRRAAPSLQLRRDDGRSVTLADQLKGSVTAVQLMFTGCSAVCPLQGALFASLQAALSAQSMRDVRLLSLSIDPLGDSPAALSGWLKQYGANAHWSGAAPTAADLDRMLDFLGKRGQTLGDRHTTELHLFDPEGRLAWRTSGLPPVAEVIAALTQLRA